MIVIKEENPKKFADKCLEILTDKKATDGISIELKGKTIICDYFVLVSGNTERQVKALAKHLSDEIKEQKRRPLSIQGLNMGIGLSWIMEMLLSMCLKRKQGSFMI